MQKYLVLLIIVLIFSECGTQSSIKNDWDQEFLKGEVRTLQEDLYGINEKGEFHASTTIRVFNRDGFIEKRHYSWIGSLSTYANFDRLTYYYEYDNSNRLIAEKISETKDNIEKFIERKSINYDSSGRKINEIRYQLDSNNGNDLTRLDSAVFLYGQDGYQIYRYGIDWFNGGLVLNEQNFFNDQGQLLEAIRGKQRIVYYYSSDNLLKKRVSYLDDSIESETSIVYTEFDEYGNWTEMKKESHRGELTDQFIARRTIEYFR